MREWFSPSGDPLVNLDKLTYAGNLRNLESLPAGLINTFVHGDIADHELVAVHVSRHEVFAIVNFAAESRVDRPSMD